MNTELIVGKSPIKASKSKKLFIDKNILNLYNASIGDNIPANKTILLKNRITIFQKCKSLYNQILPLISKKLNEIHNCKFNEEYWEIIVGPWLNNFISISYNRYFNLKKIFKDHNISSVNLFENFIKSIPINNYHLNQLSNDNNWNAIFYSNIIKYLDPKIKINLKKIKIDENTKIKKKNYVKIIISYLLSLFYKKNDPVITSTYLPFYENLKLFFYLKKIPQIWITPDLDRTKIDFTKRNSLKFTNYKKNRNFENFVKEQIPYSIPICHIELFDEIKKKLRNMNLPQNPKFIYTTNNYEYDEYFKLYVATKKNSKTKYIIGQHGNISWLENIYFEKQHKADHYLFWGKNGFGKNQNGFNFKINRNKFDYNSSGHLLIIDSPYGTNNKIFNRIDENHQKEKNFKRLLSKLDDQIKKNIVLKLHSSYLKRHKNYIKNIKEICPEIQIETNNKKTFELVKNSRCVLHLYDSTGILETMSYNLPTVCTWQNRFNHILPKYHRLYQSLEKSNIYFNKPIDLSKHLNDNWVNLNKWWKKKEVQKNRSVFLNKLSIFPNNKSIYKLSKKLIELSSQ